MVDEGARNGESGARVKQTLGFSLPFANHAPSNPLEVMAAAAVAGIAISNQFAGAFFGVMQAAMAANTATTRKADVDVTPEDTAGFPSVAEQHSVVQLDVAEPVAPAEVSSVNGDNKAVDTATEVLLPKRKTRTIRTPAESEFTKAGPNTAKAKGVTAKVATGSKASQGRSQDLKRITGIGPKLAMLLNELGVRRYEDIAQWTDKEVEHFDRELGLDGRIVKDDWIAQAKALQR